MIRPSSFVGHAPHSGYKMSGNQKLKGNNNNARAFDRWPQLRHQFLFSISIFDIVFIVIIVIVIVILVVTTVISFALSAFYA